MLPRGEFMSVSMATVATPEPLPAETCKRIKIII